MNNARESYCLLIETNPPRTIPIPARPPVRFLFPLSPARSLCLFHPLPISPVLSCQSFRSFRPFHSRLIAPHRCACRAFSLYPRIKRIVYDKSSVSSLTKRPLVHYECTSRCIYMLRMNEPEYRLYGYRDHPISSAIPTSSSKECDCIALMDDYSLERTWWLCDSYCITSTVSCCIIDVTTW